MSSLDRYLETLEAERDRYRAALESIVEMECFATLAEARVAREALSSEAGKR